MAVWQKYLFETSFDSDAKPAKKKKKVVEEPVVEEAEVPPPPPAPTFSEEELAAAREEGFRNGYREGQEKGRQAAWEKFKVDTDQIAVNHLRAISAQIEKLQAENAQQSEEIFQTALSVSYSITKKMLPSLEEKNGLSEVQEVVKSCIHKLYKEPKITIRVSNDIVDALAKRLKNILAQAGFEGKLVLQADETMSPSDVQLLWMDGGAERNSDIIWQAIEEAVARALDRNSQDGSVSAHVMSMSDTEMSAPPAPQPSQAPQAPAPAAEPEVGPQAVGFDHQSDQPQQGLSTDGI